MRRGEHELVLAVGKVKAKAALCQSLQPDHQLMHALALLVDPDLAVRAC